MDHLTFSKTQILKYVTFLGVNYMLIRKILQRKKLADKQNKKIYEMDEVLSKLQQFSSQKQPILIKAQPAQKNKNYIFSASQPVYYNQLYLIQPSLNKIANKIKQLLSSQKPKDNLVNRHFKWQAYIDRQKNKTFTIEGFGHLIDNQIFDIKWDYEKDKDIGILRRFWGFICYVFQILITYTDTKNYERKIEHLVKLGKNQKRAPLIKGPFMGTIHYIFKFVTNQTLLLQATISDGKIIPIICGLSRLSLDDYYSQQKNNLTLDIVCLLASSLVIYLTMFKDLRRKFKILRKMLFDGKSLGMVKEKKVFELISDQLTQDKLCIICYTSCRNVVLFNCKHLIMCRQCSLNFQQAQCPICKTNIQQPKQLYQAY